MESARRWSGYVCPDCRFVFRVPRDHDGKGIVCPSCRRMLKIPGPGDTPLPLMAPLRRAEPAEDALHEGMVKKRRRTKNKPKQDQSWDASPVERRSGRQEKRQMTLWLVAGGLLLAAILGGGVILMKQNERNTLANQGTPAVTPPAGTTPDLPAEVVPEKPNAELLAEAEPVVRQFLSATRVDQVLPLVRDPETAEARLKEYYPSGEIPALGLSKFNFKGEFSRSGNLTTIWVTLADFESREIAFVDGPDGIRIDWESWVGWSEMPWQKFRSEKPQQPMVFRVIQGAVAYYNFGFSDDTKWMSYRLISPDGEHAIFGYVEKGSELDKKIWMDPDVKKRPITLSLRFPANATTDNQVEIVGMVTDGWVEGVEPK